MRQITNKIIGTIALIIFGMALPFIGEALASV
jgi:hypothetical protein